MSASPRDAGDRDEGAADERAEGADLSDEEQAMVQALHELEGSSHAKVMDIAALERLADDVHGQPTWLATVDLRGEDGTEGSYQVVITAEGAVGDVASIDGPPAGAQEPVS